MTNPAQNLTGTPRRHADRPAIMSAAVAGSHAGLIVNREAYRAVATALAKP